MAKKQYEIAFEDEHLLIVDKPSGLLTIPDRYRTDILSLYSLLEKDYGSIFIVHRLDKGTSGLVAFAKTEETHRLLSLQFQERLPTKRYMAIAQGVPFEKEGTIEAGLSPNKEGGMHIDIKRGKPSVTAYKVVESFDNYSLIECTILTGRTHQIRVHLQYIGHPLAVDPMYSNKETLFLSEIKNKKFNLKKEEEELPILSRVPLHSYSLTFVHPITKETVSLTSKMPKDMQATLNQLKKWNTRR